MKCVNILSTKNDTAQSGLGGDLKAEYENWSNIHFDCIIIENKQKFVHNINANMESYVR